jgi:hypothetical protein
MPKATLEYILPDEADNHLQAVRARDYIGALWDIAQEVRRVRKYEEEAVTARERLLMTKISDIINNATYFEEYR